MKIRIDVPCFNRKKITELCLMQLNKHKNSSIETEIRIYNDNSTEYDNEWLSQWGTVVNYKMPEQQRWLNIHTIRYKAYLDFLEEDFDYLYMTDNDAIHDPQYLNNLLNLHKITKLPVCGYKSKFMQNYSKKYKMQIQRKEPHHVILDTNGGISIFVSKAQVKKIMTNYDTNTKQWDCLTWHKLHNKYALSKFSHLDHYGKGGLHNRDWNFDYAINPTPYLKALREPIIEYLEDRITKEEVLKVL